jgi:hypothetical protein
VKNRYLQQLPAIGLSIERTTENVPDDGAYYLIRNGETLSKHSSLKSAQIAWKAVLDEAGWRPEKRHLDPEELLRREDDFRERTRFNEYWGSSHQFRTGGKLRNR